MLKVLIVDDETVVRRGIVLGVDWASMDCVVVGEAANGEEGLAAAERYNPNLIITDVRMPRMDGIEMMRRLREKESTAHFIILTAYDEFDYARAALRYGAADYLLKPFRDQDLMSAIARVREKEGAAQPAEDTLLLPKGDKSKYVLQTLNYIAEHYADTDINIASIARHIGISVSSPLIAFVCEPELSPSLERPVCRVSNTFSNTLLCELEISRLNAERASRTFETSKSLPIVSQVEKRSL